MLYHERIDFRFDCIMLLITFIVVTIYLLQTIEGLATDRNKLRTEAIECGYAEWTVDINGESTWNWISNPNKEIPNGN